MSATAFAVVRFAGASYLVFLGARALIAALRGGADRAANDDNPPPLRLAPGAALRQGIISNLVNPKMAVFFTGLLP